MTIELRALHNLARAASAGASDVDGLLGRLCASLAETFGFERVDAFRYVPERNELVLPADGGARPLEPGSPLLESAESAEPVRRDGELVLPLVSDRVVGFLVMPCPDAPPEAELELLSTCGAVAAAFLQRALELEELTRIDARKTQFITHASHELRAPATVVHGIAKTVQTRARELPAEQLASLHDTLVGHTARLTRLLDELLDLSRLEARAVRLERVSLPVRARLEEIVRSVAGERQEGVSVDVPEGLTALLDPTAFERIVANLLTNALRHGSPPVEIRAAQTDRHFRVTVEDHGAGVAPGFVPRLFDRFSRAPQAEEEGKPGSGLGLSIAQSYAHAQGGQLFYEEASPHGARFQLVLPSGQG